MTRSVALAMKRSAAVGMLVLAAGSVSVAAPVDGDIGASSGNDGILDIKTVPNNDLFSACVAIEGVDFSVGDAMSLQAILDVGCSQDVNLAVELGTVRQILNEVQINEINRVKPKNSSVSVASLDGAFGIMVDGSVNVFVEDIAVEVPVGDLVAVSLAEGISKNKSILAVDGNNPVVVA